jgi:hypothetical protein
MTIDSSGNLDANIPISADLINSMNTSHFTNNVATSKIDISSSYVAPNATKLATSRNIASVGFDGSGNIDIPYFNLTNKITVGSGLSISAGSAVASPEITVSLTATQIPDLGAGKITSGTFSADRIPDLGAGKITSGTFSADRIPNLDTGKITSGTLAVDRGGTGAGTFTAGGLLIGNTTSAISQATGLTWTTATTLLTATNIAGNGSAITALNMGNASSGTLAVSRGGTGTGTFTLGGILIGNTTSAFSQSTGLTWTTGTNLLTATNFSGNGSAITSLNMGNAGSGTLAVDRGGTGAGTFTSGGLLFGNTTSALSQSTGLTWNTGTNLLTATNIAGNGSAITSIPYFNLTNKITVGNGLSISTGSTTTSPNITLNLSAVGDIAINTAVNPATIGVSYTSANLIGVFNTTDFVNTASKITLTNNTSNYVARINTELTTSISGKQATINSTAGQLIIGNGNGATTTNTGLTWTNATNLLSTSNLSITGAITGNITANGIITFGPGAQPQLPVNTSSAYSWGVMGNNLLGRTILDGGYSSSALAYDLVLKAESNLRIQSGTGAAAISITTANNVGIGKTNPNIAYKLEVVGDVNITGAYCSNGTAITGSKWTTNPTIPANIYFSSGNVGIGIADVTTSLGVGGAAEIVAYGATVSLPAILTCTPAFTQFTPPTAPDNTIYRGAIFTYVAGGYSLTVPAGGIITDILMVGGGGGGAAHGSGGGGGGAVLYGQNIFIPAGVYTLYVANVILGQSGINPGAIIGESTTGFGATILGGGSSRSNASYNGGSGAGGTCVFTNFAPTPLYNGIAGTSTKGVLLDSATLYNGNSGGIGVIKAGASITFQSGGGGGAGGVGGNGNIAGTVTGNGGAGVLVNITGTNFYWGGGGGAAGCLTAAPSGGIGGGGAGTRRDNPVGGGTTIYGTGGGSAYTAPVNNNGGLGTGGGGGGVHAGGLYSAAGSGGSGIIILKYRSPPPSSSLVNIRRNTTSTGNYNMGLVGGDFKIQSTIATNVVDRMTVDTLTGALTLQNRAMSIGSSGNAIFSNTVSAPNITSTNTLTSTTTAQLTNVLINGTISNNNVGTLMFWYASPSFGASWCILMNPWITNNLNSAQLNIHNLVVWDTATSSSYFAVLGFTASLPQQVLYLSTAGQNKGVAISSLFGYDGSTGNGYIYFPGVAETNQLRYRLT